MLRFNMAREWQPHARHRLLPSPARCLPHQQMLYIETLHRIHDILQEYSGISPSSAIL